MEITSSKPQEKENPSPMNSPNSNGSSTITTLGQISTPPLTPKQPISSRSESKPYPTTFVQADTTTFKQVVQMLTGSSETAANKGGCSIPPIKTGVHQKKQGFAKLYERRNSLKNGLIISPLTPHHHHHHHGFPQNSSFNSPRGKTEILSPSILDFPSLVLSPVTPLNHEDPFNKSSPYSMGNCSSEEEKAIAEKKFYLHPSPRNSDPPQLLPLFPLTSPRLSSGSS